MRLTASATPDDPADIADAALEERDTTQPSLRDPLRHDKRADCEDHGRHRIASLVRCRSRVLLSRVVRNTPAMAVALSLIVIAAGAGLIVWGAELFAEHLAAASAQLGVTSFALALLLAGAEPEELATTVTATVRGAPGVAFGDVIGANVTVCLVALGAAALIAAVPFGRSVRVYAVGGLVVGVLAGLLCWNGHVGRLGGGCAWSRSMSRSSE